MRRLIVPLLLLVAAGCGRDFDLVPPALAGPPIEIGGGISGIQDHGTPVASPVNRLNFLGAGVTVARSGTDSGLINLTFGGGGGGGFYQTVQANGAGQTQQPILDLVGNVIACVNDGPGTRTVCTWNQTPVASTSLVGSGRLLNTTAPLSGGGDHTTDRTIVLNFTAALNNNAGSLDVTAAAPSVTVKSENTAASAGAANSFIRTDAQLQVATAAPVTNVTSDANASTQGSSNNLIRADARLVATTAVPGTTIKSEATAAGQGASASLLRADAQLQAQTAAPSVSVVSDVSSFLQGVSSSLLRADARFTAATAAPSVNVLTDASTFSQGTSSSLLRADARFIGTTASAVAITGNASSQGTSTSFARADHTHAITLANGSLTTGAGGMAVAYGFAANTALQGSDTLDQINAPVAPVSMGSQRLINLATCTSASDGCPKSYIDGLVQGLQTKSPVRVATTVALPANTYLFVACAGDTITVTALGVCPTIDGVTLALNDRVLVKNEGTSSHDGIYTVTTLGTALLSCVFTRASDMNASTEFPGAYVLAIEGTTNSNTGWTLVADPDTTFTCGTTSQTWTQFSGLGDVTANAPLSKSGNALSLNFTAALNLNGSNLDITAASPSVTVQSEATAASTGVANSFVRTDAQIQAFTAASTANVLSDASTTQRGTLGSLLRSDARLLFSTAAPSTNVTTDANASTLGTATSGVRSDARHVLATAAPASASVQTDHAATAQGSAGTSLRSDATFTMLTAAPTAASVISDHGAVAQGVSNSGLRADATFTALTAAPVALDGTASNTQGTSNSLSRADHIHATPASISIAQTWTAAGTAVTVNNNMLVSGTLTVTGVATLNSASTLGQVSVPAVPSGTNLAFANVAVANQARPYFRNSNYGSALGICPPGSSNHWTLRPQAGHASISAGTQVGDGINVGGHIQFVVSGGGGCTMPAASGSTYQTRAPRFVCSSAGTTARTFADIFTGSAGGTGEGFVTTADGFFHVTTMSTTVNIAQEMMLLGFGRVFTNGADSAAVREGIWFTYNENVSSQTGNWQFVTTAGGLPPTGFTQTDLGNSFPRSVTNMYQMVWDAPPALTNGVGFQICDVTTPGIGTTPTCTRGVQSTNLPGTTTELVLEELALANPTAVDGGTGADGAAASSTAVTILIYDEEGCGGWYGVQ